MRLYSLYIDTPTTNEQDNTNLIGVLALFMFFVKVERGLLVCCLHQSENTLVFELHKFFYILKRIQDNCMRLQNAFWGK